MHILKRLKSFFTTSRVNKPYRKSQSFRPQLEILEERAVPTSSYAWVGGHAGDPNSWAQAANWSKNGGGNGVPGSLDNVAFPPAGSPGSTVSCAMDVAALNQINNFTMASSYTGTVTLDANTAAFLINGAFSVSGGTLINNSAYDIEISNTTANANQIQGLGDGGTHGSNVYIDCNGTTTMGGIKVLSGATLDIYGTVNLGDHLYTDGTGGTIRLFTKTSWATPDVVFKNNGWMEIETGGFGKAYGTSAIIEFSPAINSNLILEVYGEFDSLGTTVTIKGATEVYSGGEFYTANTTQFYREGTGLTIFSSAGDVTLDANSHMEAYAASDGIGGLFNSGVDFEFTAGTIKGINTYYNTTEYMGGTYTRAGGSPYSVAIDQNATLTICDSTDATFGWSTLSISGGLYMDGTWNANFCNGNGNCDKITTDKCTLDTNSVLNFVKVATVPSAGHYTFISSTNTISGTWSSHTGWWGSGKFINDSYGTTYQVWK